MKKLILPTLLIAHLALLYTLQFTAWPEMFSYPYLVNNGLKLYHDIIYPYPPLLVAILARLYTTFGYSIWTLKIFTWSLLLTNDLLIFAIVKKFTKNNTQSYFSLIFYILAQSILEGNMMWFDIAIVTPLLTALYLFLFLKSSKNKYQRKSYFLSIGFMLTLAALTKQTTAIFLVLFFFYFVYKKVKFTEFVNFLFAPVFMGGLLILKLLSKSRLIEAFNWTFLYPFKYWSNIPGYVEFNLDKNQVYILFLLIIPVLFALFKTKGEKLKTVKTILFAYLIISILIIYPRFSFFHFQLGIAVTAISLSLLKPKFTTSIIIVFILIVFFPKYKISASSNTRFIGESEKNLAIEINSRVKQDQSVYLFNIHSGIYHLAGRLPPKPWFDNFAWYLEIPCVQSQILSRWEQDPPDYIYFQNPQPGAWYELGTYLPKDIIIWMQQNYKFVDMYNNNIQIYKHKPVEPDSPGFVILEL